MDLGHNQQQYYIVHNATGGGVGKIPWRSPAPPLPVTFRSPSAYFPIFVDTF